MVFNILLRYNNVYRERLNSMGLQQFVFFYRTQHFVYCQIITINK